MVGRCGHNGEIVFGCAEEWWWGVVFILVTTLVLMCLAVGGFVWNLVWCDIVLYLYGVM